MEDSENIIMKLLGQCVQEYSPILYKWKFSLINSQPQN